MFTAVVVVGVVVGGGVVDLYLTYACAREKPPTSKSNKPTTTPPLLVDAAFQTAATSGGPRSHSHFGEPLRTGKWCAGPVAACPLIDANAQPANSGGDPVSTETVVDPFRIAGDRSRPAPAPSQPTSLVNATAPAADTSAAKHTRGIAEVLRAVVPPGIRPDPRSDAELDQQVAEDTRKASWDAEIEHWRDNVPPRFAAAVGEDPTMPAEVNATLRGHLREWHTTGRARSLLLTGARGSGKSWAGMWYVQEGIRSHLIRPGAVRYAAEPETLSAIDSAPFNLVEQQLREFLSDRVRLLLLDDVGTGRYTNQASRKGMFERVMSWAYLRNITVVVTTNLGAGPGGDLARWMGVDAYDRMVGLVAGGHVRMPDADQRRLRSHAGASPTRGR